MSKKPIRVDEYRIKVPMDDEMQVDAWIYASEELKVEEDAVNQLCNGASLPGVVGAFGMPDIHRGYGVPIGSVVGLENRICPAAVGYDINCGMRLLSTKLRAEEVDVKKIADSIARDIPLGEGKSNVTMSNTDFEGVMKYGVKALLELPESRRLHRAFAEFDESEIEQDIKRIEANGSMAGDIAGISDKAVKRGTNQLGTIGGGNHFIELQVVEKVFDEKLAKKLGLFEGQFTIMIHTGSRGFGHQICEDYSKIAKKETGSQVVDPHLSFFIVDSYNGEMYLGAMHAAANFAFTNREVLTMLVRLNLKRMLKINDIDLIYDVTHNIAKFEKHNDREIWVHRKGTTRAFPKEKMQNTPFAGVGQPVLIPGSMGTSSYVLVGTERSNVTFNSVNHGAGRVMSRTAAAGKYRKGKRVRPALISDTDFEQTMQGVYLICEDRKHIKEEAPAAYKDIDEVIKVVTGVGLAQAVARMRPLAVLKG